MIVLLTGATGFLGRNLLDRLCEDARIERIHVPSRRSLSHPDGKVVMTRCDLAEPGALACFDSLKFDAVVHLAANYDFCAPFETNYLNNVVCTENLLRWLSRREDGWPKHLVYASSYAVGIGQRNVQWSESPLEELPPREHSFPRTKAMAERLVLDSAGGAQIFRLGVPVGDSKTGSTSRLSTIHSAFRTFLKMKRMGILDRVPVFPVFGRRSMVLPLVPVDIVARTLHASLFRKVKPGQHEIFGLYNPRSVSVERMLDSFCRELQVSARPWYVPELPRWFLDRQYPLTHIPRDVFDLATCGPALSNPAFRQAFPDMDVPDFSSFESQFYDGFYEFIGETRHVHP